MQLLVLLVVCIAGILAGIPAVRRYARWAWLRIRGGVTVRQRLDQYGIAVRFRLDPDFRRAGVEYPLAETVLIAIKDTRVLEVWCRGEANERFALIRTYPILAASGGPGPKLREGDRQVPEGLYRIESLNPNSRFHLALRVDYPNEFDRRQAERDGRTDLGGDIMIHGSEVSIGCLAMGDEAAEDLFVLAADTGLENVRVILTPVDFRTSDIPAGVSGLPAWTDELYAEIRAALRPFRR